MSVDLITLHSDRVSPFLHLPTLSPRKKNFGKCETLIWIIFRSLVLIRNNCRCHRNRLINNYFLALKANTIEIDKNAQQYNLRMKQVQNRLKRMHRFIDKYRIKHQKEKERVFFFYGFLVIGQ